MIDFAIAVAQNHLKILLVSFDSVCAGTSFRFFGFQHLWPWNRRRFIEQCVLERTENGTILDVNKTSCSGRAFNYINNRISPLIWALLLTTKILLIVCNRHFNFPIIRQKILDQHSYDRFYLFIQQIFGCGEFETINTSIFFSGCNFTNRYVCVCFF